jgi:hypothetical protein
MDEKIITFCAAILGTLFGMVGTIITTIVTMYFENKKLQRIWADERERRRLDYWYKEFEVQKQVIRSYVFKRISIITALANPIQHPQEVISIVYPEIWKMGGETIEALSSVRYLNIDDISSYITNLDDLLIKVWRKQSDVGYTTQEIEFLDIANENARKIEDRVNNLSLAVLSTPKNSTK